MLCFSYLFNVWQALHTWLHFTSPVHLILPTHPLFPQALAAKIGMDLPTQSSASQKAGSSTLTSNAAAAKSVHSALRSNVSMIGAAEANLRSDLERADALLRQAMDQVLVTAQVCVFVCVSMLCACVCLMRSECVCSDLCVFLQYKSLHSIVRRWCAAPALGQAILTWLLTVLRWWLWMRPHRCVLCVCVALCAVCECIMCCVLRVYDLRLWLRLKPHRCVCVCVCECIMCCVCESQDGVMCVCV